MQTMYYIGLDVHKKKISYCVKDGSGHIHAEGAIPAARSDLDRWMCRILERRPSSDNWTHGVE
jgi:transposase